MQKIIYKVVNKLFMNEPAAELLNLLNIKEKIIFDVGCFRGNFTENLMKHEEKNNNNSNYYLFDANPNVQAYLKKILEKKKC
jgi:hypothetical protein